MYTLLVVWCVVMLAPGVLTELGVFGPVRFPTRVPDMMIPVWIGGYLVSFGAFFWAMSIAKRRAGALVQIPWWFVASMLPWVVDWATPVFPLLLALDALIAIGTVAWIALATRSTEALIERGIPAAGVVIEVIEPRMNVVINDVYLKRKVRLQVERDDGAPGYEAVLDGVFMVGNIPSPGDRIRLLVDPNKPQHVVYDSGAAAADSARASEVVRSSLAASRASRSEPRADQSVQDEPGRRDGVAEELERLARLHARGVLTDAEFTAAKAKLLGA